MQSDLVQIHSLVGVIIACTSGNLEIELQAFKVGTNSSYMLVWSGKENKDSHVILHIKCYGRA